jgi:hypothetical protein
MVDAYKVGLVCRQSSPIPITALFLVLIFSNFLKTQEETCSDGSYTERGGGKGGHSEVKGCLWHSCDAGCPCTCGLKPLSLCNSANLSEAQTHRCPARCTCPDEGMFICYTTRTANSFGRCYRACASELCSDRFCRKPSQLQIPKTCEMLSLQSYTVSNSTFCSPLNNLFFLPQLPATRHDSVTRSPRVTSLPSSSVSVLIYILPCHMCNLTCPCGAYRFGTLLTRRIPAFINHPLWQMMKLAQRMRASLQGPYSSQLLVPPRMSKPLMTA